MEPIQNKLSITKMCSKCFIKLTETFDCAQVTLVKSKLVLVNNFYPHMIQAFFVFNRLACYGKLQGALVHVRVWVSSCI